MQSWRNKIPVIGKRYRNKLGKLRCIFGRDIFGVIAKIGPNLLFGRACSHHANKVQQKPKGHRRLTAWYLPVVDMVNGVAEPLLDWLFMPLRAELEIFVDRLGNDAQMQLLCTFGLAKGVKGNAVFGAIFQPVFKREAIALRLRNLFAFFIEEHLVNQAFGRTSAKHARNLARLHAAVGQVLAIHFVINAKRDPAHRPIDFPLKLRLSAQDRLRDHVAIVVKTDKTSFGIHNFDGHLKHHTGFFADRQDRRIGRRALFAQGRQHDVQYTLIIAQHIFQRSIERTAFILRGRRDKFIFKAELIKKMPQHGIVVRSEAFEFFKRVWDARKRFTEMFGQHRLVRHIVGHLAQTVHIVGKFDEPRGRVGQCPECVTDHGGAQDFVEGADMRQA